MTRHDILLKTFAHRHPLEAARVLERLPAQPAADALEDLGVPLAAPLFEHMTTSPAVASILLLPTTVAAHLIEAMPLSDGARLLRKLPAARVDELLALVKTRQRLRLLRQLRYPAGSVAAVMDPNVCTLPADITVAEAQKRLKREQGPLTCELYVVDARGKPVGLLPAVNLWRAGQDQRLAGLAQRSTPLLPARADLTAVREMAEWQEYQSLPVVGKDGTLLGALHYRDLVQPEGEVAPTSTLTSRPPEYSPLELCWLGLAELMGILAHHNPKGGRP
ncbi:MAG: CBS domain-containing protein [Desulfurivibrio sp.]|nr:CBS domain-containing protein [Desulfurivibrio sp.]